MRISKRTGWAFAGAIALAAAILYFAVARESLEGDAPDGSAPATASMARYRAGQLEIGIAADPATPRVGENRLVIELRDADGEPVSGAAISAEATMPAMGQMPEMRAPATLEEVAPGRFEGPVNLSMRGEWPLTVRIEDPKLGNEAQLRFDYATDRPGLEITAGAVPVATPSSGFARPAGNTSEAGAGGLPRFRVGELELAVGTEPATPEVGQNRLIVEVRKPSGEPATDVEIDGYAEMPAMGAMPAMRAPAGLEQTAPGRFEGSMNLSMRGEWPLTLQIKNAAGGEQRLRFDLATDRPGLTIAAGGSPVGASGGGGADDANVITIDNRRRQMIGVETGRAELRELVRPIRAVGEVTYDERRLSHVTLKFDGYIGDLKADYVGAPIEAGQELFTVYSPELLAAQQEYLQTVRRRSANGDGSLLRAARQRLRLWDMTDAEIEALERRGMPQDYVAIYAPRNGTLIERNIADGSAARMGQTLLTVADLSRVWIEAEVFEADLELVQPGMTASVMLPYLPGRQFEATVEYVYPYLEGATRTGRVRLTLDNTQGILKPEMYAEVSLRANLGERLSVPEEAVIIAGESRVVFIDLGEGRLKPTRIKTGRRAQGFIEVLDGLSAGDAVVTSGNFLLAAETRLKTGIEQW
jgi:membrane fusion protein, copper/silver efflux system